MKILTFSTLFPNAVRPAHGVFVENRLRHLLAAGGVEATVVAPVPWFPSTAPMFGEYAAYAAAPRFETRHGLAVHHPRYPVLPKIGMTVAPRLLYYAARRAIARLIAGGLDFDLIDAHYFYPDGVAAVALGRAFDKPVVITARGTDLNLIADFPGPRRQIVAAAAEADGLITVARALKDKLVELGTAPDRVAVLRNGVDLSLFRPPADRAADRERLGLTGPALQGKVLLSVGHLIERKGHDLAIAALETLPDAMLLIAGTGPLDGALRRQAAQLGVAGRVRFLGQVAHEDLPAVYGAADALVLASSREGWANVLLEAMACGTPAVASDVWGTGEIVAEPAAGVLMATRSPEALSAAVGRLFAALPDRAETRAYAERFSWDATTAGQLRLFERVLGTGARAGLAATEESLTGDRRTD
ncbi:MAG: glycosyltransferase family 4 protein [Minwuiales bacterium]|nr:glycosyltransferase family 4 protein [Minwuiales bacterium]